MRKPRLYLWIKWHYRLVPDFLWFLAVRKIDEWHDRRQAA